MPGTSVNLKACVSALNSVLTPQEEQQAVETELQAVDCDCGPGWSG